MLKASPASGNSISINIYQISLLLGRIFAKIIIEHVISFKEAGQLILEGGEEPRNLIEMGLAAEDVGTILETNKLEKETLVRLTSVCKSWHSLITVPKFISQHLHRTASNPDNDRFLVRYRSDKPKQDHYSLVLDGNDSFHQLKTFDYPFDSVGYSVVGSCT
ncbi:hypothetical protein RHGRI_017483 [Rhododendron griersonianum]|uniref:F-box domain-containing protein n=1 Tax=Rhododendron griersonianum TaxID=479676 RepID=A0AAV6JY86_9ERIC|nr:hypothetical protein RHGRI_017483 [Rhododendron griersonianum]